MKWVIPVPLADCLWLVEDDREREYEMYSHMQIKYAQLLSGRNDLLMSACGA